MMDGAYDYNNDNFRFLAKSGIEPVIKVMRSNSSTAKANGCKPRKLVVIEEQLAADVKYWKKKHGYGMRWMAESVFSSIKRMFGEYIITSVKWKNIVNELMLRASIYNMFIDAAAQ
jgi:transposase